jgi:hypothetical protein
MVSDFDMNGAKRLVWGVVLLAVTSVVVAGQAFSQACNLVSGAGLVPLVTIGSQADQAFRDSSLLGRCPGSLIRSPLSLSPTPDSSHRVAWLTPVLTTAWNSTIPVTGNTGAMWAGRGWNASLTAGMRWDRRFLTIIVAPEITGSANRGFPVFVSTNPTRSEFASPWYNLPTSADLPIRFGSAPFSVVTPGQSTIELHGKWVGGGLTTENQWWGPGIRNAIVMSNNAAGIPQAYFRTVRPLRTPAGDVELRMFLGELTPSRFFERGGTSLRSISAGVITLRTAFDTGLTIGGARAVYAPINGTLAIPKHWADVLWRWNQQDHFAYFGHPDNQILSLFYRWVFPDVGFETYGEWARLSPPRSLQEIVVQPQTGQGFTVGLQSLRKTSPSHAVRIQAEATMLEQTPPNPGEPIPTFYTSHLSPGGYTQRGQVIGAAIGPGGSSQFVAADLVRHLWSIGVELGRIQWNDEAYYQQPSGQSYKHHDVSLFAGLRGSADYRGMSMAGELIWTHRMNFLFQTADINAFDDTFDMRNLTFKFSLSPSGAAITQRAERR